jgi:hypothetical protein
LPPQWHERPSKSLYLTTEETNINCATIIFKQLDDAVRSRREGRRLRALRERLADWAAANVEKLCAAEPVMPVEDRAADTWDPLIAVADAVGGHWPDTARAACVALVREAESADEEQSLGVKLLADIASVFADQNKSFLSSRDLVTELWGLEDSPWSGFDYNPSKLVYRLREFGIKPGRDTTDNMRGYALEWFADAFARYTRQNPSDPSETASEQGQSSDRSETSDGSGCQTARHTCPGCR